MIENQFIAHRRTCDGKEQSLITHLTEVGDIAEELASKIGIPVAGKVIGMLHDFGKYGQKFQGANGRL